MIDPHAYNITVRKADFEGEVCFEARVRELPDLAEYGDSYAEVYELAIDAIMTTAEVLDEKGRAIPGPQDISDDFSGRITLRLPKSLHRGLSISSEEEGVSLNQYIVNILSYYSGYAAGAPRAEANIWETIPGSRKGRIESCMPMKLVCSDGTLNDEWKMTG